MGFAAAAGAGAWVVARAARLRVPGAVVAALAATSVIAVRGPALSAATLVVCVIAAAAFVEREEAA
jgi:hypothetical protein